MGKIDYIAGLFDGEGSVIIRFRENEKYKTGYHIDPHINITNMNKEVLDMTIEYFGYGYLYWHKRDQLWYLNIYKIDELIDFTEILLPHSIIKKKELEIFLQIMKLMKKKVHLTFDGLQYINDLWCGRK